MSAPGDQHGISAGYQRRGVTKPCRCRSRRPRNRDTGRSEPPRRAAGSSAGKYAAAAGRGTAAGFSRDTPLHTDGGTEAQGTLLSGGPRNVSSFVSPHYARDRLFSRVSINHRSSDPQGLAKLPNPTHSLVEGALLAPHEDEAHCLRSG